MTSFAASSLRWLRRLAGAGREAAPRSGYPTVLDGLTAIALTEALVSDTAALGATFPGAPAARAWDRRRTLERINALGEPLDAVECETARGALAAAMGAAMSGARATTFLSGPDLAECVDLLGQAGGRHAPMVVHLAARAAARHAQALGAGHDAYHAAAGCGWLQLFAINVQEAVDLSLIARCAAERALVPGLVAMDAEQTALAAQDVCLPEPELIHQLLGEPFATIDTPTDAQRLIFGTTRRRVPRLYDLERPMMLAPLQGPESWALGAAGLRSYFHSHVPRFLAEAQSAFAELTGRHYGNVFTHAVDRAELILVAQGSAVETAMAVAQSAHRRSGVKVGVLGIRCLRPLPVADIALALKGAKVAAVLERTDAPDDGPLLTEIRSVLDRAREAARFGPAVHPGCPAVAERHLPRLIGVPFGMGGLPLRAADLTALIERLVSDETLTRSTVYLGLEFVRRRSVYPKHQALMDEVRRSDPDVETLGLRSAEPPPDVRPAGATTVAVHGDAERERMLSGEAAALIHEILGGAMRSRPALTWQRFDEPRTDVFTHAEPPLLDPGDDVPFDIVVCAVEHPRGLARVCARLAPGGAVLLASPDDDDELRHALPAAARSVLAADDRTFYAVRIPADGTGTEWARTETLLGGLLALVVHRRGAPAPSAAAMRAARAAALEDVTETVREQRLDVFAAAFDTLRPIPIETPIAAADLEPAEARVPALVRGLSRSDRTVYSVPRFWDHAGVFYRTGAIEELVAEPGMSAGTVPPLTSTFRDVSPTARALPALDPETCDGDPALWMSCPDGSIAPLVISPRDLIDAGIDLATARGGAADALRGVASRIATRATAIVKAAERRGTTAGALLDEALLATLDKMDAPPARRAALTKAMKSVVEVVGELPLVRTRLFFDEPERVASGSGELFSLVVNPDAGKSPELILSACAGRGLRAEPPTPENIETARRLWSIWEQLPDTRGATIERVRQHPEVGPLAALMLSRHCSQAVAGGDGAEAGSGAKLALRRILAVAEFHHQPRLQRSLDEIRTLRERLGVQIREVLADALPTSDLDALAGGLEALGQSDVDLTVLSSKVDTAVSGQRVDGARLTRLVDVARGLADLEWRIAQGPEGLGRSRMGLAIASGAVAAWAGAFPYNPFQCPVAIDAGGEVGPLARGLLDGQLRQALAGLRLTRWARTELERPAEAAAAARGLPGLGFGDLTADERALCPPVLVVGDDRSLGGRGLSQLVWLLESGLPVKVVVLGDIGGAADGGLGVDALDAYPAGRRFDLALLALLTRRAFVVQTSLAHEQHFYEGVQSALAFDGPALIVVHAPSPQRHGFAVENMLGQARLAVDTRAFPLMTFDPAGEGVFGSRLDLTSNPQHRVTYSTDADGRALTPVDWAAAEARFAAHFEPLAEGDGTPTPVAEYLELAPAERDGRAPFVTLPADPPRRLRVGPAMVTDVETRLQFWRTLQELAGVVTPFVRQVREDAERDVAQVHRSEIADLQGVHEMQLAQLREAFEAEAIDRVAEGLLTLAGQGTAMPGEDGVS